MASPRAVTGASGLRAGSKPQSLRFAAGRHRRLGRWASRRVADRWRCVRRGGAPIDLAVEATPPPDALAAKRPSPPAGIA
jgi:hypothetical protein